MHSNALGVQHLPFSPQSWAERSCSEEVSHPLLLSFWHVLNQLASLLLLLRFSFGHHLPLGTLDPARQIPPGSNHSALVSLLRLTNCTAIKWLKLRFPKVSRSPLIIFWRSRIQVRWLNDDTGHTYHFVWCYNLFIRINFNELLYFKLLNINVW